MEHSILSSDRQLRRLAEQTPPNFVFAIKGSRYITHMPVSAASSRHWQTSSLRPARTRPKLGQSSAVPPNFQFKPDLLEEFFALLQETTQTPPPLLKNTTTSKGRAYTEPGSVAPSGTPRDSAFQLRRGPHSSASCAAQHRSRLCRHVEWPAPHGYHLRLPYCRLHGSKVLYTSHTALRNSTNGQRA